MSDKNLEGFTAEFNAWKDHPMTKDFFFFLEKEADQQIEYLSSIYLTPAHPGNKLMSIGAFSHTLKMLKALKNITAEELLEIKE